mmetsp:Transcript_2865/g.10891  ORF Transcript_2865/g.10891 Transcript_2865/m.10891 type:complete len:216 (-) Transcript_2865:232-879(-)
MRLAILSTASVSRPTKASDDARTYSLMRMRTRVSTDASNRTTRRAVCIRAYSPRGTRQAPTWPSSSSIHTRRRGSKPRHASATRFSNISFDGCARPSTDPKAEPRCTARASKSRTCSPNASRSSFSTRVFPVPVRPATITMGGLNTGVLRCRRLVGEDVAEGVFLRSLVGWVCRNRRRGGASTTSSSGKSSSSSLASSWAAMTSSSEQSSHVARQ